MNNIIISISKRRIVLALCIVSVVIISLSVVSQIYRFYGDGNHPIFRHSNFFYLSAEQNLPTFYSVMLLVSCSLLFFIIGRLKKVLKGSYRWHWTTLGLIFFYLAMDEALRLHERTSEPLQNLLNLNTDGLFYRLFYFTWVILAVFLVLIFCIFYWKFLFDLPVRFRKLFILSGSAYVAGPIGVEILEGLYISKYGQYHFNYTLLTNLEESLEIFGSILLFYSLYTYIESLARELTVRLE
jgi:hypothetical protein